MGLFSLVHFSDLHLSCAETSWREVLDRRFIGYVRWRLLRRRKHDYRLLDLLTQELRKEPPEHIIITGDLTHLGLPAEFKLARRWLERFGPPEHVSVVPGNHDAYRLGAWEETFAHWGPYLKGEEGPWGSALEDHFPLLRRRGEIVLIGVSTACPNFPPWAVGRVGRAQRERLKQMLRAHRGSFRVVFLHHPPLPGVVSKRKALLDLSSFFSLLLEEGCELVLFGHSHRTYMFSTSQTTFLGAPALTCRSADPQRRGAYFRLIFQNGTLRDVEKRLL